MTVNHIAIENILTTPIRRALRIADAFVPAEWAYTIAGSYDDLREFAGLEFSGSNASADWSNLNGVEICSTAMLEPDVSSEKIKLAIAIHIECGHTFGILERGF